jgi:hypothetical protein
MIRRTLGIASTIIASLVITACSDTTGPTEMQSPGLARSTSFAEGSRQCPAPGTGLPGALNMLRDPTMADIPMTHDAQQGNDGMFHAADVSGC